MRKKQILGFDMQVSTISSSLCFRIYVSQLSQYHFLKQSRCVEASLNIGMLKLNKLCDVSLHDMQNSYQGYYLNLKDLEGQAFEQRNYVKSELWSCY